MKKKFSDGERRYLNLSKSLWKKIDEAARADNREWYDYLMIILKERFLSSTTSVSSTPLLSPSGPTPDLEELERRAKSSQPDAQYDSDPSADVPSSSERRKGGRSGKRPKGQSSDEGSTR